MQENVFENVTLGLIEEVCWIYTKDISLDFLSVV